MKASIISVTTSVALLCASHQVNAIGITVTGTGMLQDTILFASPDSGPPVSSIVLGDIDLSTLNHIYSVPVAASATQWWLIGHEGNDVVYSSSLPVAALLGISLYNVEPYDIPGAQLAWNIPANLQGYASGVPGSYSTDWLLQTDLHHSSHLTADGGVATSWFFSNGQILGAVAVSLHNDIAPTIPEPSTVSITMLLLGSIALYGYRRHQRR